MCSNILWIALNSFMTIDGRNKFIELTLEAWCVGVRLLYISEQIRQHRRKYRKTVINVFIVWSCVLFIRSLPLSTQKIYMTQELAKSLISNHSHGEILQKFILKVKWHVDVIEGKHFSLEVDLPMGEVFLSHNLC